MTTLTVQPHVAWLRSQGWTLADIAIAAGLNVESFRGAMRRGTILSSTAARVLAVADR
jgi:hypothetical protein